MRLARATFLALLAVGAAALEASPAAAAGGVYNVVKCHPWHLEADEIEQAGGTSSYLTVNDCRGNASDRKIGIYNNGGAGNNAYSQYMYTAPFGTHIETVCLDHNLRRDSHHQAQVLAYPGFQVLASGGDGPAGWTNGCFDLNHSQLIVRLACSNAGGCAEGLNAHAYVRNIVIALADDADPSITAFGGDMTASGWLRGSKTLTADAADWGSGVYQLVGYVNGVEIGRVSGHCSTGGLGWNFALRLAPCAGDVDVLSVAARDDSLGPFVDGAKHGHRLRCGLRRELSRPGRRPCSLTTSAPHAAFANRLDPADPELIAADRLRCTLGGSLSPDLLPSRRGGELAATRHASRIEQGSRSRRLVGSARQASTSSRLDVDRCRRELVRDHASRGRLADAARLSLCARRLSSGRALERAARPVKRCRTEPSRRSMGGCRCRRRATCRTSRSSWSITSIVARSTRAPSGRPSPTTKAGSRCPSRAGPTRSIEATFAGTNRYLPADDEVGKFAVKGAASFRVSSDEIPEGTPVRFKGRVKHRGARIPAGGKLVEIQYRLKTGRQRTLKEPFRTKPDGSYRPHIPVLQGAD